jgi:hypothetical protein
MVDFYEEMANFAAMSEDDGFLGRCGTRSDELAVVTLHKLNVASPKIPVVRPEPKQLPLLAIPEQNARTNV